MSTNLFDASVEAHGLVRRFGKRFDSTPARNHPVAMVLLLTDLEQLGQTALQEFDREVAGSSGAGKWATERHAQRLEAKLEQLYAVAATIAQREDNLEGVSEIWARMVSICDDMAKALSDLQAGRSPHSASYDRILDIRNVCEENRVLHA